MYKENITGNIGDDVMSDYRNDVNNDYNKCIFLEKVITYLFLAILILSIVNTYINNEFAVYFIVFLNIAYVVISFINDIYFINIAENERRKTNISDSFKVNITSKKTNLYYNNQCEPSIKKMGVNSFESTLYTKNTLSKMMLYNSIKTFLLGVMWIMIIVKVENVNIFQITTELFFSAEVLLALIKNIYYYFETKKLYDNFYYQFITKKYNENEDLPIILQYILEYECLKSYCHFLLSEKIFEKDKSKLKEEWTDTLREIK